MVRKTFADLHYIDVNYFNVFVLTGIVEPMEVYLKKRIEELLDATESINTNVTQRIDTMFNLELLNGLYEKEELEQYVRTLGDNQKLENCDYPNLFSPNYTGASRLCMVDLAKCTEKEFTYYLEEIREKEWGDNLILDKGTSFCTQSPIYLFFTFDNGITDDKTLSAKDYKDLSSRKRRLKALEDSLIRKDHTGSRATSRLLWISAKASQRRRDIYTWMLDILGDRVTKELLWECSSACGELNSLRGFYKNCVLDSESVALEDGHLLGDDIKKKDLRRSELYTNLLFIDGRTLAKCSLRFIKDKNYKGVSLKSLVKRGYQIELLGLNGERDEYQVSLRKAARFLRTAKNYFDKWLRIRALMETGIIPTTLSYKQLNAQEVVDTFRHYEVGFVSEFDMEIASTYDMEDIVYLLELSNKYLGSAKQILESNAKLDDITSKKASPADIFICYFGELKEKRKSNGIIDIAKPRRKKTQK